MRWSFLLFSLIACNELASSHPCESAVDPELCYELEAASLEEPNAASPGRVTDEDSGWFNLVHAISQEDCFAYVGSTKEFVVYNSGGSKKAFAYVAAADWDYIDGCSLFGDIVSTEPPSGFGGPGTEIPDYPWIIIM